MAIQTLGLSPPERRTAFNNPAIPLLQAANWAVFRGGNDSAAGEVINDAIALQITTVFSCVSILANAISSLPIKVFKITPQGKIQDLANPLHHLLSIAPNDDMNSVSWLGCLMTHLSLTGNSFSEIERDGTGMAIGLWPLSPRLTDPVRMPNGDLAYKTSDGMTAGQTRIVAAKNMLHCKLNAWDGILGMSPIMQARQTLGMARAAEKLGSRLFKNFAMPQLALKTTAKVKPEDKTRMRQDWEDLHSDGN